MIKRFTKGVLRWMVRSLVKFMLFVLALTLLALASVAIYISSPTLINSTLPYVLDADEPGNEVRFVRAMQGAEVINRYGFPSNQLEDIYYFAQANQLPVIHSGERQPWLAKPEISPQLPPLAQAPFGLRYVLMKYPDVCMEMAIIEHKWVNYQLALEVNCHGKKYYE